MKRAGLIAAVLVAGLAALWLYGMAQAAADPVARQAELTLPKMAPRTAPYRVALLSDIHFGNRAMRPERLARIVDQINAAKPDLIVIVGDFVNGKHGAPEPDPKGLTAPLAGLHARDGVVATLGNHDHWTDATAVRAALAGAGIEVLINQAAQRGPLLLLGIDDGYSRHANIAAAIMTLSRQSNLPIVAITHSPDLSPRLPSGITLVLAGHTHCGQVVLPIIGALAPIFGKVIGDREYYDPHYQCGIVRDGPRTTIVTAGLGSGSVPIRIGAPPDWWLISLDVPSMP